MHVRAAPLIRFTVRGQGGAFYHCFRLCIVCPEFFPKRLELESRSHPLTCYDMEIEIVHKLNK